MDNLTNLSGLEASIRVRLSSAKKRYERAPNDYNRKQVRRLETANDVVSEYKVNDGMPLKKKSGVNALPPPPIKRI